MVYLWGGIHKCQSGWMSVWKNSLIAPLVEGRGGTLLASILLSFGYVIPVIEIGMALALDHIPKEWNDYLLDPKAKDGHMLLSPSSWSSKELNVPLISEWRIIRRFSETLCSYDLSGSQVRFYVDHRHLPQKPKQIFSCDQTEEMR
jgi:hypothetical protein